MAVGAVETLALWAQLPHTVAAPVAIQPATVGQDRALRSSTFSTGPSISAAPEWLRARILPSRWKALPARPASQLLRSKYRSPAAWRCLEPAFWDWRARFAAGSSAKT